MATILGTYNDALRLIGADLLASTTEDAESRYALDEAWDRSILFVLRQASWRHALVTESLTGSTGSVIPGFTYKFSKPANWLRTNAIFVVSTTREVPIDVKDQGILFYAHQTPIVLRYVTKAAAGIDPALWPEHFAKALAAYLAFQVCERLTGDANKTASLFQFYENALGEALVRDAMPESTWLRHQLNGALLPAVRYVLEQHSWHFAIVTTSLAGSTTTPSAGFTYRFTRPADWIRSSFLYYPDGSVRDEVEFREEGGYFHANTTPLVVRYISKTLGEDATLWSDAFEHTLLAYLNWREVMTQPDVPGAALQARAIAYHEGLSNAKAMDERREQPRVNRSGSWVRSRGGSSWSREQGLN
ncbi:MAG: hypothetical protein H0U59_09400 [Gemmatimonadaceae bacterium]|nr:hypothetical protein [Gemmatimonadaceae bacterium]